MGNIFNTLALGTSHHVCIWLRLWRIRALRKSVNDTIETKPSEAVIVHNVQAFPIRKLKAFEFEGVVVKKYTGISCACVSKPNEGFRYYGLLLAAKARDISSHRDPID